MTGNQSIRKNLTDTRGIESHGITTIYILEYQPPTMTGLQVRRASDTSGTLNEAGEYIRIDVNVKRSELNRRGTQTDYNPTTMKVYAKKSSDTTSTLLDTKAIPAGSSNQSYTITTPISETSTYEVQVILEDKLNAVGQTVTLPTQKVPFSIGKDEGIGVGKIWEAGALDISSEGGVAIDGVLKKPWPWLTNLGTLVDGTDFNTLDDGFYLNSGYTDVFNAPPIPGVLMQFTGLNYIAQFVIGIHEMAWRLKTVAWMPWNSVSEPMPSLEGAITPISPITLENNYTLAKSAEGLVTVQCAFSKDGGFTALGTFECGILPQGFYPRTTVRGPLTGISGQHGRFYILNTGAIYVQLGANQPAASQVAFQISYLTNQ